MKEHFQKILNKEWRDALVARLSEIVSGFNVSEKFLFSTLSIVLVVSGIFIIQGINEYFTVHVPAQGGYLREGIIGSPRFVNPVLAVSDVDHDLAILIYSGLVKVLPDNTVIPDLAQSFTISPDGLVYDFILRDDVSFHDGKPVTAADVEFTILKIQDALIKSPKRPAFYDVAVQVLNEREIRFTLKKPYAPFLQSLSIGILPKHLWNNLNYDEFPLSQYNVEPIGSGPYKVSSMKTLQKNMLLIPTYYELVPFNDYALGQAYIEKLFINFYRDEKGLVEAYNNGDIEAMNSISPENFKNLHQQSGARVETIPLPRTFVIFFNQTESEILANKEVRQALDMATDRQKIVSEVLNGYGTPIYGPIPAGLLMESTAEKTADAAGAIALLEKAGWKQNPETGIMEKTISKTKTLRLAFSITTLNSPDLAKTAELVKADWEAIGVRVEIKQFEFGDLQQNILRPRKFDALLYGTVTGRDMDFFAFWHSSQRNDPGLNIAMYTNSRVDTLIEEARRTQDTAERMQKYLSFAKEVANDVPAIFLYSPDFIYIVPDKIHHPSFGLVTLPYERFLGIQDWFIETNNEWRLFSN